MMSHHLDAHWRVDEYRNAAAAASAASDASAWHGYRHQNHLPPPPSLLGLPPALEQAPFPQKLHHLLADVDQTGLRHIVSWQQDGRSFRVHSKESFCKVVRRYFKLTKMKSFTRQLNLYGFVRVQQGPMKGSYGHPLFQRHRPDLLHKIHRKPRGSSHVPARTSIPHINDEDEGDARDPQSDMDECSEQTGRSSPELHERLNKDHPDDGKATTEAEVCLTMSLDEDSVFGGDDTVHENLEDDPLFQSFVRNSQGVEPAEMFDKIPFGMMEFHTQAEERTSQALDHALEKNSLARGSLSRHFSFPFKLHDMLCDSDRNNLSDIISWVSDDSFKVHSVADFVEHVMPYYFDQTKYPSFRRQLNSYGFTRADDGSYTHVSLSKSNKSLCKDIIRRIYMNAESEP